MESWWYVSKYNPSQELREAHKLRYHGLDIYLLYMMIALRRPLLRRNKTIKTGQYETEQQKGSQFYWIYRSRNVHSYYMCVLYQEVNSRSY